MATEAAAVALQTDAVEQAALLLEQGRTQLFNQLLDMWSDFGALRMVAESLARQLEMLRAELIETETV